MGTYRGSKARCQQGHDLRRHNRHRQRIFCGDKRPLAESPIRQLSHWLPYPQACTGPDRLKRRHQGPLLPVQSCIETCCTWAAQIFAPHMPVSKQGKRYEGREGTLEQVGASGLAAATAPTASKSKRPMPEPVREG